MYSDTVYAVQIFWENFDSNQRSIVHVRETYIYRVTLNARPRRTVTVCCKVVIETLLVDISRRSRDKSVSFYYPRETTCTVHVYRRRLCTHVGNRDVSVSLDGMCKSYVRIKRTWNFCVISDFSGEKIALVVKKKNTIYTKQSCELTEFTQIVDNSPDELCVWWIGSVVFPFS